jgi:hypothetical protein
MLLLGEMFLMYFMLRACFSVEEDEMGGACSTNGGEAERVWVIGWKAREKQTARKTKKMVGG